MMHRMRQHLFIPLIALAFLALVPRGAQAVPALELRTERGVEIITLNLPGAQQASTFTLSNPERLVVDVPVLPPGVAVALPGQYKGGLVKAVRTGRFDPKTTRIVFELAEKPAQVQSSIEAGKQGARLHVALTPAAGAGKGGTLQLPARPGGKPVPALKPEAAPKTAPKKEPLKPKEDAKQKEDPRPVIVIDAGHGGQDPGTVGPGGTQEKEVVLEFARSLRKALLATGRYRVYMTRDDDTFILLRKRVEIARKAKADLFVSIHADSAADMAARGLSVYTLSEKASDAEAEALAARENKVDVVYGLDLSDQSADVADILISLAQRDTNNRSATLAGTIVDAMTINNVRLLPNSHRFAGFAVLKAPDIPSMLVETGFLSHPQEEKQLKGKAYREKVVAALMRGVDAFFAVKRAGTS